MWADIWNSVTWDAIKEIASWVAIGVSIIALWTQIRRSRFTQGVDLILKLENRFEGNLIKSARKRAAKAILNNRKSPGGDVDDVLDFFEMVGLFYRRHALDEDMVWCTF